MQKNLIMVLALAVALLNREGMAVPTEGSSPLLDLANMQDVSQMDADDADEASVEVADDDPSTNNIMVNVGGTGEDNQLPGLNVGDEFGGLVGGLGGLAATGAKVAGTALRIQSKLVAPIFGIGAKVAAPIIKLKAKLAAPLVAVGTVLAKPLIKTGVKVGAPAIALGQLATAQAAAVTKPVVAGLASSVQPVTNALRPLNDATRPIRDAFAFGTRGIDVQAEVDQVEIEDDVNSFTVATGNLVTDAANVANLGINAAVDTVADVAQRVTGAFNKGKAGNQDDNSRRRRRKREAVDPDYNDYNDPASINTVDEITLGPHEDVDRPQIFFSQQPQQPFPSVPPAASQFPLQSPEDVGQNLLNFLSGRNPFGVECSAMRTGLITSECHREETYHTQTCSKLDCSGSGIDQIIERCQVSAPDVFCKQRCLTFEHPTLGTCFNCNVHFTVGVRRDGKCARLNDCLFGGKICPNSNS